MSPGDARVFLVGLDQPAAVARQLEAVLAPDERAGSARVRIARAVTRVVVADALGTDPHGLVISRRCAHCGHPAHGRPTVEGDDRISFSLSHSGAFAVIALAGDGTRVGVDVEAVRPRRRLDALAARVMGDDEHGVWLSIGDADARLRAFLRSWTAKEAYLKALGIGIATRLRDVPTRVDGWRTCELDVGAQRIAAIAGDRSDFAVRRATVPAFATGYREIVLDDDEDYAAARPAPGGDDGEDDGDGPDGALVGHAEPAPIERFRRTTVGTVLAAGLLGLRDVLETPKDETPAIVETWAAREPFREPIVLRLDPDHPEDSIVMVRPWLDPKRARP